ncbi:MAG TPA: PH domain-containing protein [Acidimicrobiales bacterium]
MGILEARRTTSSALRLAGLMIGFAVFAVAVVFSDDVLAGEGRHHINHRGTQLVFAWVALALAAWMLPGALLDLLDGRPAVCLDYQGGEVRATLRRRRFRWDEVVAIDRGRRWFTIRLERGRPVRVGGEFEPHDLSTVYDFALTHWVSTGGR